MLVGIVASLALFGFADAPPLDFEQLLALIRDKQAPMRSLALVLEGTERAVGDPARLDVDPGVLTEDFQAALLLRGEDAFLDYYRSNPGRARGVVREKIASLRGAAAYMELITDARRPLQLNDAHKFGSRINLRQINLVPTGVRTLFATWILQERCEMFGSGVSGQGWEVVDGRSCLKVRYRRSDTEAAPKAARGETGQYFWVDLDRGAVTLRMESLRDGQVIERIDQVAVEEFPQPNGPSVWVPVHARFRQYLARNQPTSEPTLEVITATVAGSIRVNESLPDSLFSVMTELSRPDSAAPAETRKAEGAGGLIRRFRAQKPKDEVQRTDPESVRKRVVAHLDEANKQAEELQASSSARQAWSGTLVAQVITGVLGAGLLVAVLAARLRSGA